MKDILNSYVSRFNNDDREIYEQYIKNSSAYEWLKENIPLIEIPDKTIEEIYYFRWWVFRKHVKKTEDGYVISEFLPPVSWAGRHNTIIAPVGHHIAEAKWLKCGKRVIEDYSKLWLEEKSKTYSYSSWLIYAVFEFCSHMNDFSFAIENLDLLINYYEKTSEAHITDCGLFWSLDLRDGMEYSISGVTEDLNREKGIRPTLNSYMAASAYAISEIAKMAGKEALALEYYNKYLFIKDKMVEVLWDGTFYKAIHNLENIRTINTSHIRPAQNVKELIGYIPWCFDLAPAGFEGAFEELKLSDGFHSEYGLTTAERRHPRYLYSADHENFWNGHIWPFATSQVLNAVINLLDHYDQKVIDKNDFYDILYTYAKSHYLTTSDGKTVCWIDEEKDPETNEWASRNTLEAWGWPEKKGGYERGKDYNHSSFCDIVLRGLLGVDVKNGEISVSPKMPDDWNWFMIDNLWVNERCYKIVYDKDGTRYNCGKGLQITLKSDVV